MGAEWDKQESDIQMKIYFGYCTVNLRSHIFLHNGSFVPGINFKLHNTIDGQCHRAHRENVGLADVYKPHQQGPVAIDHHGY